MTTLSKIKPGDKLYDVHSERAGNTTMRRQREWVVYVKEVHIDEGYALCSWNGNPPTKYYEHSLKKLRTKPAAKLNGHVRECPGSYDGLMWGKGCTCPKPE